MLSVVGKQSTHSLLIALGLDSLERRRFFVVSESGLHSRCFSASKKERRKTQLEETNCKCFEY